MEKVKGKVLSIHVSAERGVVKNDVDKVMILKGWGLDGDAHGGDWDRQVSIFPVEALAKIPEEKREEVFGDGYTENITISGIPLENLMPNIILQIGEAEIEVLYIGKEELKEHGRPYIVSREGRFGRVHKSGKVKVGDEIRIIGK